MKLKFIGCEVIYREACHLAAVSPHEVDLQFLRKGLHSLETPDMVSAVQSAIDAVDPSAAYEAILLGYARCNDGLVGVTARTLPVVLPRAHDCITFFFGSRRAYQEYFDANPGTYYMTTGWCERNDSKADEVDQLGNRKRGVMEKLGLADSYEQMVAKYGKDNADFIVQSLGDWKSKYTKFLYLKMGLGDEQPFIEKTRRLAEQRRWTMEIRDGSWTLLEKLFFGRWDEDFVIVRPGQRIVARNDLRVLDAVE